MDNPIGLARELNNWAQKQSVRIAFTQWIAGWLRHPYTEPTIASAYVERLPESATLERIALRPVSDAGKIWLHVPNDEGVFLETRTVQQLPLVSDAQIYLDLQKTGLRGPDQANALRVAYSEAALLTLWPILEPWQNDLVLVGGLVPRYICGDVTFPRDLPRPVTMDPRTTPTAIIMMSMTVPTTTR